jgi:anti-sigma regulatory factor (Ser/Thr protein kinase)
VEPWNRREGLPVSDATRSFAKSIDSLGEIFEFLDEALHGRLVDDRARFMLHLAVEELFTNMVKYNSGASRAIRIEVDIRDGTARVELVDPDTDFFDPGDIAPVDPREPIERRRPGGLGVHLVRALMGDVEYRYRDREMTVSVKAGLE